MGWNPFKTVKKVVKSIGKGIKKIGKGLKKIMSKIAKPFAKLGIVGQIALGFLMPWAAGAIWTGLTGTTFSLASMGTVAGNLTASSNIFAKAAGYVMKGVHWGATKVQNAYQYVTDKISSGIDALTGRAKETLGPTADAGDLINDAVQNGPDIEQVTLTPEQITQQAKDSAKSLFERIDAGDLAPEAATDDLSDLFDTDLFASKDSIALKAEDSVAALQKKIVGEATKVDKGFLGRVKESFSTALAEAPSTIGKQVVTSAATGIGDLVKQGIVGEAEMGSYATYDIPDFLSLSAQDAYTKYNQVDLTMQNNSFAYGGPSYMANLQETGFTSDPYFDYFNRMLGRG